LLIEPTADTVLQEGPLLRTTFSLMVSLMALVRAAALVATSGHSRAETASLVLQLGVWLAASATVALEVRRRRERSIRVLLLCGLDWFLRTLGLYSDLAATPTRLDGGWRGSITILSYTLACVLVALAIAVGYCQSCSEVEGKRMETYMLLRRGKDFPKVLRLLILASKGLN